MHQISKYHQHKHPISYINPHKSIYDPYIYKNDIQDTSYAHINPSINQRPQHTNALITLLCGVKFLENLNFNENSRIKSD